jgi:hypothetical protein
VGYNKVQADEEALPQPARGECRLDHRPVIETEGKFATGLSSPNLPKGLQKPKEAGAEPQQRGARTTCKMELEVSTGSSENGASGSNGLTLVSPKVSGTHASKRGACVSLRLQNWSKLLQFATYTGNPRMGLPANHRESPVIWRP